MKIHKDKFVTVMCSTQCGFDSSKGAARYIGGCPTHSNQKRGQKEFELFHRFQ